MLIKDCCKIMLIARLNNIGRRQVAGYSLLKKVYHHFSDKVKNLDIMLSFFLQKNDSLNE